MKSLKFPKPQKEQDLARPGKTSQDQAAPTQEGVPGFEEYCNHEVRRTSAIYGWAILVSQQGYTFCWYRVNHHWTLCVGKSRLTYIITVTSPIVIVSSQITDSPTICLSVCLFFAWGDVSVHWQQGKFQLWAKWYMCAEHHNHSVMAHPSKTDWH